MHFERAIELSGGKDLSIKVEYARRYARLVFDQELHDRLLTEVLNSPTEAQKLTLFNVLAKQGSRGLARDVEGVFLMDRATIRTLRVLAAALLACVASRLPPPT